MAKGDSGDHLMRRFESLSIEVACMTSFGLFDAATGVALKSTLSSAPLLLIDTTIHSFIKIKPSSAENEWIELIFEGGLHTFLENSRLFPRWELVPITQKLAAMDATSTEDQKSELTRYCQKKRLEILFQAKLYTKWKCLQMKQSIAKLKEESE
ncbi:hypothetical protein PILCRDRAFT_93313 [Piloderma croceum F 1598]|uniref:Uncharacterized protein n=1 Tax=Piloderma croceum (strain F 1598) TaxID=765440 RepID=A0A0C3EJI7_PILCF|nr:hypothetical protein PILCRDRAFT_93313 [Piloderma croceum F 1598]